MTLVGIDVGWSEKRASCGIALSNGRLPLPDVRRSLRAAGGRIRATRLKLGELVKLLSTWSAEHPDQLADAIVVIDGPLGPNGPPQTDRAVDGRCATGVFRGWSQPTPISHPSSKKFISATYEILAALGQSTLVWIKGERPQTGITVVETNPTVALAMMMPRVGAEQITTRGRPLPFEGVLIAAKSDWYWRNGAGRQAARALATGNARDVISKETDHELCAALTCLALAHQFGDSACDGSKVVALGDDAGIYLLPADIDQTWEAGFYPLFFGQANFGDHASQCSDMWGMVSGQIELKPPSNKAVPEIEQCELAKSDCCTLILADNGGVWEKHNQWLRDMASPVRLAPVERADYEMELWHASERGTSGQWKISPTAMAIARLNPWSSNTGHLSLRHPCTVDVRFLD